MSKKGTFRERHNDTAMMLCHEGECYIAVEKRKGAGMEICIAGDGQQLLMGLIGIAARVAEKSGAPGGAWESLMAAADVAKMIDEYEGKEPIG